MFATGWVFFITQIRGTHIRPAASVRRVVPQWRTGSGSILDQVSWEVPEFP